jgi:D-tyrosyl-tRNA(Tyr) deacylase
MRAVIQRVSEASVSIEGEQVGCIGQGLLVLLAVSKTDTERQADYLAEKLIHLRVFEDADGALNRSLSEIGGALLVISQFTLLADCRKGRRPSFSEAAGPEQAHRLYDYFIRRTRDLGIPVQSGRFRARMAVSLVNDGPVTLILEN